MLKYQEIAKYFCFYCCGLLYHRSYLSILFCLTFITTNTFGIFIWFGLGYIVMRYFNVIFIVLTGVVSSISYNKIILTEVKSKYISSNIVSVYTRKPQKISIGQTVTLSCYNYRSYLRMIKIHKITNTSVNLLHKIRAFIEKRLSISEYADFCKSVILGIPMLEADQFRKAGTYHLLAISGLHFMILMRIFQKILLKCCSLSFYLSYRLPIRSIVNIIIIILSLGYLYLIFAPYSAIKAFLMSSAYLLIHNRIAKQKLLLIIAFCILLFSCNAIFDWSFGMSFLASFALSSGSYTVPFYLLYFIPNVAVSSIFVNMLVIPIFSILLPMIVLMIFISPLHYPVDILIKCIYLLNKIVFLNINFSNQVFLYYFLIGYKIIYPYNRLVNFLFVLLLVFSGVYNLF